MSRSKRKRLIKSNLTKTITTTVIATGVYTPFCLSTVYAEEIKTVDKQVIEAKSKEIGIVGWGLEDKDGNIIEGHGSEANKADKKDDSISKLREIKSTDKDSTGTNKLLPDDNEISGTIQGLPESESKKVDEKYPETGIIGWGLEDKDGNIIEGYGLEEKKADEKDDSIFKLREIKSTDKDSTGTNKLLPDDHEIGRTTQNITELAEKKPDELPEKVTPEIEITTKLTNEIDNSYTYKNEKKEDIKTLWVKGIIPPKMGENGDFTKEIVGTKKYYVTSQDKGNGWYDVNKSTGNLNIDDFALCGGATAANMLHWWLEQNQDYVDKFIKENPKNGILEFHGEKKGDIRDLLNSYDKEKHSSEIFNLFKEYFGRQRRGIWADTTIDMFINGYIPSLIGENRGQRNDKNKFSTSKKDPRGGFFRDVFKEEILTERDKINSYENLSDLIKKRLGEGRVLAISHMMVRNIAHIVTVWGADYDSNGNLKGLYLSDSDDYNSEFKDKNNDNKKYSMKRYNVENKNGKLRLSTEEEEGFGVKVLDLYSLSLGKDTWDKYFKNNNVDKNFELVKRDLEKLDTQYNIGVLGVDKQKTTDKSNEDEAISELQNKLFNFREKINNLSNLNKSEIDKYKEKMQSELEYYGEKIYNSNSKDEVDYEKKQALKSFSEIFWKAKKDNKEKIQNSKSNAKNELKTKLITINQ